VQFRPQFAHQRRTNSIAVTATGAGLFQRRIELKHQDSGNSDASRPLTCKDFRLLLFTDFAATTSSS
jgi:hypothetical protein